MCHGINKPPAGYMVSDASGMIIYLVEKNVCLPDLKW